VRLSLDTKLEGSQRVQCPPSEFFYSFYRGLGREMVPR